LKKAPQCELSLINSRYSTISKFLNLKIIVVYFLFHSTASIIVQDIFRINSLIITTYVALDLFIIHLELFSSIFYEEECDVAMLQYGGWMKMKNSFNSEINFFFTNLNLIR
jgi:hypothetical protein